MSETQVFQCPRCQVGLRSLQSPQVPFHACDTCGGVWLDRASMDRVLQADAQVTVGLIDRVTARAPYHADTSAPGLRCPACFQSMAPVPVPEATAVVDVCQPHGWWFDRDELKATVAVRGASHAARAAAEAAPGAERGTTKKKGPKEGVAGGVVAGAAVAGVAVAGAAVLASQHSERSRVGSDAVEDAVDVAVEGADVVVDVVEVVAESGGFWEGLGDVLGGVVEVLGSLSD